MSDLAINFGCFLLGVGAVYAWNCAKTRYQNWRNGTNKPPPGFGRKGLMLFAAAVIILGAFSVAVQTQRTHNAVRDLTMETQRCYRQFALAINARSGISKENEELSRAQREALADTQKALSAWIAALLNPPPDIAALPPSSEARRAWGIRVTNEFNKTLATTNRILGETRARAVQLDEERRQHPLPSPDCGEPDKE